VENRGTVSRVAATVDASHSTIQLAVKARADLMIVHHGLFWESRQPWTKTHFRLLQLILENNLAVYSAHLPLDAHPRLGNSSRLCAALGFKKIRPFFFTREHFIGFQTKTSIPRTELAARLRRATGAEPLVIPGGNEVCERIGIVTGG